MRKNEQMGLHQTKEASIQQKKQSLDSRDSPQNGRKSLPATHLVRGRISRIYRKLKKLSPQ
jgi:hypothetical protein